MNENNRQGRLLIIGFETKDNKHYAKCQCDCGTIKLILNSSLKSGKVNSCGCLQKEIASASSSTHGKSKLPEYQIWLAMKQRCYNENRKDYHNYGGRGITVCDEWKNSFENFYRDMGERPSKTHSLDRIKNELEYSKENCKWSTKEEQSLNRRTNVHIEWNNETKTLGEWQKLLFPHKHKSFLQKRLKNGWTIEKAFTTL